MSATVDRRRRRVPETAPNLAFAYLAPNALVGSAGVDLLHDPSDGEAQEPAEFLDTFDLPTGADLSDADDVLNRHGLVRLEGWALAESGEYWSAPVA